MSGEWQPIELYDSMSMAEKSRLTRRVVFFVEATKPVQYRTDFLTETIALERRYGSREVTKFYVLPPLPKPPVQS